jgi:hypothetical protein
MVAAGTRKPREGIQGMSTADATKVVLTSVATGPSGTSCSALRVDLRKVVLASTMAAGARSADRAGVLEATNSDGAAIGSGPMLILEVGIVGRIMPLRIASTRIARASRTIEF